MQHLQVHRYICKKKLCSSLQAIDGGDGAGGGCQELVVVALVALRVDLPLYLALRHFETTWTPENLRVTHFWG